MDICKLCLKAKPLVKSHIIPKFCYKHLKDEKNSFIFVDGKNKSTKIKFDGEYEKLLCSECENILGKYETYVSKVLYHQRDIFNLNENPHGIRYLTLKNNFEYDYCKFKLFLLSIVWRASVSAREAFTDFSLPSDISESLRTMLHLEDPKEPNDYPCLVSLPPLLKTGAFNAFDTMNIRLPQLWISKNEYHCYFVITGMICHFCLVMNKTNGFVNSVQKNQLNVILNSEKLQSYYRKDMIDAIAKD